MRKLISFAILLCCFCSISMNAQKTLSEVLKKYNNESIPYITVEELLNDNNLLLLDAREKKEYDVSHLKNAIYVGYEQFNLKKIVKKLTNKNTKIVVYCSLGVRSEDIAEKLKNKGYSQVYNLYGGIFEWKNKGNSVFFKDSETQKVHAFSIEWGQWLLKGEKVYE